jgi:hypothetical protein
VEADVEVELTLHAHLPVPALRPAHLAQAQALGGVGQRLQDTQNINDDFCFCFAFVGSQCFVLIWTS